MAEHANRESEHSQENIEVELISEVEVDTKNRRSNSNLLAIYYLLNEESEISMELDEILGYVANAGPRNYKRILDYLVRLNENIKEKRNADPRAYARVVLRGNDEPA